MNVCGPSWPSCVCGDIVVQLVGRFWLSEVSRAAPVHAKQVRFLCMRAGALGGLRLSSVHKPLHKKVALYGINEELRGVMRYNLSSGKFIVFIE